MASCACAARKRSPTGIKPMLEYIRHIRSLPVTKLGVRCLFITLAVLILDQMSKMWVLNGLHFHYEGDHVTILPFFSLTFVQNRGMSFGILGHTDFGRWLLTVFQLVAAGALAYGATKAYRPLVAVALPMIAGGGSGQRHRPHPLRLGRRLSRLFGDAYLPVGLQCRRQRHLHRGRSVAVVLRSGRAHGARRCEERIGRVRPWQGPIKLVSLRHGIKTVAGTWSKK